MLVAAGDPTSRVLESDQAVWLHTTSTRTGLMVRDAAGVLGSGNGPATDPEEVVLTADVHP